MGSLLPTVPKTGIVPMPPDFDSVQLTPEEEKLAIFDARCVKYWNEKKIREENQKRQEREDALKPFTAKELQDYILATNPWFKVDEQAKEVFRLLCLYFSNDPQFEAEGYSLQKGICLCGPVGVGKTELLNIFRKNKRQCFHMVSVFEIEDKLQEHGLEFINSYYYQVPGYGNNKHCFYQPQIAWAFDEVGRESVQFDFGNKIDAISKIIQYRYFKKVPFSSLHITTNKSPDELEARYSEAVRSRLREMFNYIIYTGKDRR